jgi:hypothetical protein
LTPSCPAKERSCYFLKEKPCCSHISSGVGRARLVQCQLETANLAILICSVVSPRHFAGHHRSSSSSSSQVRGDSDCDSGNDDDAGGDDGAGSIPFPATNLAYTALAETSHSRPPTGPAGLAAMQADGRQAPRGAKVTDAANEEGRVGDATVIPTRNPPPTQPVGDVGRKEEASGPLAILNVDSFWEGGEGVPEKKIPAALQVASSGSNGVADGTRDGDAGSGDEGAEWHATQPQAQRGYTAV